MTTSSTGSTQSPGFAIDDDSDPILSSPLAGNEPDMPSAPISNVGDFEYEDVDADAGEEDEDDEDDEDCDDEDCDDDDEDWDAANASQPAASTETAAEVSPPVVAPSQKEGADSGEEDDDPSGSEPVASEPIATNDTEEQAARRALSDIDIEIAEVQTRLKNLKKLQKELVADLQFAIASAGDSPARKKWTAAATSATRPATGPATGTATPTSSTSELAAEADPDAWKRVPVTAIDLKSIEGLGDGKKFELLVAECPTIGALEELRAGKGLRSLRGFGEKLSDRIEDAIIDWLSKNRDSGLFNGGGSIAPAESAASASGEPAAEPAAEPLSVPVSEPAAELEPTQDPELSTGIPLPAPESATETVTRPVPQYSLSGDDDDLGNL